MTRARVYKSAKREFECKICETGEFVKAKALGNLLKGKDTIVPGDYVDLAQDSSSLFEIRSVEERKNEIFRILVREQRKKITASNCDFLIIVTSVSKPDYKQGIVDRFLVRAHQWQIYPLLVFNKMDDYEGDVDIKFESDRLEKLGVECFEVSAKNKDYKPQFIKNGFSDLKTRLDKSTSLFLGQSGVGKSSLITCLSDGEYDLKTKEINKSGKGSHTTTWSEIIDCGDFSLMDSPGIRSFSLEDILAEDLLPYFPDLEELATNCKFKDCHHDETTKGCFFNTLSTEDYDSKLIKSRLDSYKRIKEEIESVPDWEKKY